MESPTNAKPKCQFEEHSILLEPYYTALTHMNNKCHPSRVDQTTCESKDSGSKHQLHELVTIMNYWLRIPESNLEDICDIVNLLRVASIILDELSEQQHDYLSPEKSIHYKFGVRHSVNSANLIYMLALHRVVLMRQRDAVNIFCFYIIERLRGTGTQILLRQCKLDSRLTPMVSENKPIHSATSLLSPGRSKMKLPSLKAYSRMIIRKNGAILNLAVRLMYLFSEGRFKSSLRSLLDTLSLLLQVRNDYLSSVDEYMKINPDSGRRSISLKFGCNLPSTSVSQNPIPKARIMEKAFALFDTEDDTVDAFENILFTPHLTKLSYPLLLAIVHNPKDRIIQSFLARDVVDEEMSHFFVHHLIVVGSLKHTRAILLKLHKKLCNLINFHGGNPHLTSILNKLSAAYENE